MKDVRGAVIKIPKLSIPHVCTGSDPIIIISMLQKNSLLKPRPDEPHESLHCLSLSKTSSSSLPKSE